LDIARRYDHIVEVGNCGAAHLRELKQNRYLAEHLLGRIEVLEGFRDVFDGVNSFRLLVLGLDYLAEGSMAQNFKNLEVLQNFLPLGVLGEQLLLEV